MRNVEELDTITPPVSRQEYKIHFTGSAGEYFTIWLSNVCLTVITLGIFGPWAKVRREKYFYNHTLLDDSSFDFTANPVAILKGRALALVLLLGVAALSAINPVLEFVALLLLMLAVPWVINQSMRFKARYTVYRNISLGFSGTYLGTLYNLIILKFVGVFSLGTLFPWFKHKERQYLLKHLHFGTTPFALGSSVGAFYRAYLRVGAAILVMGGLLFVFQDNEGAVVFIILVMAVAVFDPLLKAGLAMATWNNATLGTMEVRYSLPLGRYVWIAGSNLVMRIFTLGLASAYCAVRMYRFKVSYLSLEGEGSLDQYVGERQANIGASGNEIADAFDVDLDIGF